MAGEPAMSVGSMQEVQLSPDQVSDGRRDGRGSGGLRCPYRCSGQQRNNLTLHDELLVHDIYVSKLRSTKLMLLGSTMVVIGWWLVEGSSLACLG